MKKEIADKWVGALRSGKYKQGEKWLQQKDKFCCLGVLCKLAEMEGVLVLKDKNEIAGFSLSSQQKVMDWSDIKTGVAIYGQSNLAKDNDDRKSFEQIAEIIETNWEQL